MFLECRAFEQMCVPEVLNHPSKRVFRQGLLGDAMKRRSNVVKGVFAIQAGEDLQRRRGDGENDG